MTTISHRILSDNSTGQRNYRVDLNNNHKPDADEPVVMRADKDGWKPAENLDTMDRFAVEKGVGYWTDKQISHKEGWFWDRKEVIDRPKNGTVEADEVSTSGFRRLGNGISGPNSFELGAEIVRDQDGALYLDEQFAHYGSHTIIGQGDIQRLEAYRQDDANWNVAKAPPAPVLIGSAGPITLNGGTTTVTIPLHWPDKT